MNWLLRTVCVAALSLAAALPALGAPGDEGFAQWSMGALAQTKARIESLAGDLGHAPGELRNLTEQTRNSLMSGTGVRGFTYLLILLLVGSATEWLYWTYAYSPLRAIQSAAVQSPRQALRAGLRRLVLLGSGLMLFTAAAIGASAAFSWPPGVQELVVGATLLLLVLRLAWVVVAIVVAPGRPQLRLVPVEPRTGRWFAAVAMTVACLFALGHFVPDLMERVAGARHAAGALRLVTVTATALLLLVAAFAFFGRPVRGEGAGLVHAPLFPRSFILAMLVAVVYAIWLMHAKAAAIAAIAALVIGLQLGLHEMVFFFWRNERAPGAAGAPQSAAQDSDYGALPAIALSVARFVVVLLGIGACALVLDAPIATLAETVSPWVRIGLRMIGVAVLALLAHGVWIAVRTVIDHRLIRIKPAHEQHDGPDANARLLTLLPLLRVTAAVLLLVMLVLSSLWALGIEITPLLAGAGVIGLALGFGAQALVRDVIAGIFFLAEDAFRVGEYIESGTATKGTVERISLRTVALRHHNGPLIFVPYGSLGTVRNTSRDWVIEKFNIPLPIGIDSEKIRKMIKKVGEDMRSDPDVGPLVIETLKGKLYRIDPGVKIFRCKFRTAPGKQFDVRAQALKRVEAALKEMGVGFADGTQTVLMPAPPET